MKRIKLIIRVNETCNTIESGTTVGRFLLDSENHKHKDVFIKPILNSYLLLDYYTFYISRIYQDVMTNEIILQEHILFSRHTFWGDIKPLQKKLLSNGWKWKEDKE